LETLGDLDGGIDEALVGGHEEHVVPVGAVLFGAVVGGGRMFVQVLDAIGRFVASIGHLDGIEVEDGDRRVLGLVGEVGGSLREDLGLEAA
jgi:hypothetical protein